MLHRVLVEAHLVAQRLGIERPAFDIGIVAAIALEIGKGGIFLGQADLEVMPRSALVHVERDHPGQEPAGQIIGVVEEGPRTAAVG